MAYPLLTRPFLRLFFGQDDDSSPVILRYEPSRTVYHRWEKADNVWPQTLSLCGPAHLWKTYSVQKRTVDMRATENRGVAETGLRLVSTLQRVALPSRPLPWLRQFLGHQPSRNHRCRIGAKTVQLRAANPASNFAEELGLLWCNT